MKSGWRRQVAGADPTPRCLSLSLPFPPRPRGASPPFSSSSSARSPGLLSLAFSSHSDSLLLFLHLLALSFPGSRFSADLLAPRSARPAPGLGPTDRPGAPCPCASGARRALPGLPGPPGSPGTMPVLVFEFNILPGQNVTVCVT